MCFGYQQVFVFIYLNIKRCYKNSYPHNLNSTFYLFIYLCILCFLFILTTSHLQDFNWTFYLYLNILSKNHLNNFLLFKLFQPRFYWQYVDIIVYYIVFIAKESWIFDKTFKQFEQEPCLHCFFYITCCLFWNIFSCLETWSRFLHYKFNVELSFCHLQLFFCNGAVTVFMHQWFFFLCQYLFI